jgi:hypothetical protein
MSVSLQFRVVDVRGLSLPSYPGTWRRLQACSRCIPPIAGFYFRGSERADQSLLVPCPKVLFKLRESMLGV